MIGLTTLFGILAIIFALGMIADKDANNRKKLYNCILCVGNCNYSVLY
jgi:hypothetical protein